MSEPRRWSEAGDPALAQLVHEHVHARSANDLPRQLHERLRDELLASLASARSPAQSPRPRWLARGLPWWVGGGVLCGLLSFVARPEKAPAAARLAHVETLHSTPARHGTFTALARAAQPLPVRVRASVPEPVAPLASLPAAPDVADELTLLRKARRALSSAPAQALWLVDEHAARYAAGMLAEERELLRLEALAALGRAAELLQRADAFQRAFPGSAHFARIDVLRETHAR